MKHQTLQQLAGAGHFNPKHKGQSGMALITAMITVLAVSIIVSAALWKSWTLSQAESSKRHADQAQWLLSAALDWSRVILKEDLRASQTDNLTEPWAVPLQEVKLSSFLKASANSNEATQSNNAQDDLLASQVFLSGQITDEHSRLNFFNLLVTNPTPPPVANAFARLFESLHLPQSELLQLMSAFASAQKNENAPLWPQRFENLTSWGLSPSTLATLKPYATWINESTTVNLNTASPLVLYATLGDIEMSQAERLASQRASQPWSTLGDIQNALGPQHALSVNANYHQLSSKYFMVSGKIRIDETQIVSRSLVQRTPSQVLIVWSERGAQADNVSFSSTTMNP
jgi:general secretion pathway protein K